MSKKPMTWLELIKLKLSEEKSKGKSPSIGDVTPFAKKEWVQIKEGKHPLYVQGKAQTFGRKKKGTKKSRKNDSSMKASSPKASSMKASSMKASSPMNNEMDIQKQISQLKLCGKCKKKMDKIMKKKTMKGGDSCSMTPEQTAGCGSCGQSGGCNCMA
jgi:hypothetical protein